MEKMMIETLDYQSTATSKFSVEEGFHHHQ
jgi:hypothetical protein